jgi:hypothetical protein
MMKLVVLYLNPCLGLRLKLFGSYEVSIYEKLEPEVSDLGPKDDGKHGTIKLKRNGISGRT